MKKRIEEHIGCCRPGVRSRNAVLAGRAGFTIIEALIAIFILSIGILAVCSMQVSGLKGNATAHQYTDYATLAMQKMETLMAMPYSSLPGDTSEAGEDYAGEDGFFTTGNSADVVEADPDGNYTIYYNVAADYLMDNTTTVSVTVVWNSRGTRKSVSLLGVIPKIT
jgi:Tfp pilus assembly protein PilV